MDHDKAMKEALDHQFSNQIQNHNDFMSVFEYIKEEKMDDGNLIAIQLPERPNIFKKVIPKVENRTNVWIKPKQTFEEEGVEQIADLEVEEGNWSDMWNVPVIAKMDNFVDENANDESKSSQYSPSESNDPKRENLNHKMKNMSIEYNEQVPIEKDIPIVEDIESETISDISETISETIPPTKEDIKVPENMDNSLEDEVEEFSLDPDFDYDNIVLASRFTQEEMDYFQSFVPKKRE